MDTHHCSWGDTEPADSILKKLSHLELPQISLMSYHHYRLIHADRRQSGPALRVHQHREGSLSDKQQLTRNKVTSQVPVLDTSHQQVVEGSILGFFLSRAETIIKHSHKIRSSFSRCGLAVSQTRIEFYKHKPQPTCLFITCNAYHYPPLESWITYQDQSQH